VSEGTWQPAVGMRVVHNLCALDGLSGPGTIVGFVDQPGHPRRGQPIVEWDGSKRGAVHPVFLWPLDYALALAEKGPAG
jgi:hypothetical protein